MKRITTIVFGAALSAAALSSGAQTGNVGIGTITPHATLEVNGSLSLSGQAFVGGTAALGDGSGGTTDVRNISTVKLSAAGSTNVFDLNPATGSLVGNNNYTYVGRLLTITLMNNSSPVTVNGAFGFGNNSTSPAAVTIPGGGSATFQVMPDFGTNVGWHQVAGNANNGATAANIYNSDGTLTGNRTVTLGSNSLAFMGGNVGMGIAAPNTNAALDITSTNKGLLPPRVALTGTNSASPLGANVQGMTVYNTATNSGAYGTSPGIYANDGSRWQKVNSGAFDSKVINQPSTGTTPLVLGSVAATTDVFNGHLMEIKGAVNLYCANGFFGFSVYVASGMFTNATVINSVGGSGVVSGGGKTFTLTSGCGGQSIVFNIDAANNLTVKDAQAAYFNTFNFTVFTY